jgi:nucleoid-associated protein YgaU
MSKDAPVKEEKNLDPCESDRSLAWKASHVSPMAREVKIGVSVIFVLLVVFGIALFDRLKGSDAESTALAAEKGSTIGSDGTNRTTAEPQNEEVVVAVRGSAETFNATPDVRSDGWGSASAEDTDSAEPATRLQSLYMPDEPGVAPVLGIADKGSESGAANPVAWETEQTAGSASIPVGTGELAQAMPQALQPAPLQPVQGAPRPDSPNPAPPATMNANAGLDQGNPQWDSPNNLAPPPSSYQGSGLTENSLDASAHSTFKASQPSDLSGYGSSSNVGSTGAHFGVPSVENGMYVVQPNDNYWTISESVYGTGAFFQALAEHNRDVHSDENWLRLGAKISVPSTEELEKLYPALCPTREHRLVAQRHASVMHTASHSLGGRVYVVQEGDSLFDIARHELGRASRYGEIIQLNKDVLGGQFDYLTPGMQLVLPEAGRLTPNHVTNRHQGYQR